METTPHPQKKGVPRWAWALVALVVVGTLTAGIGALFAANRASTDTPAPAPSPSVATAGADGCIAGRDNDAKSLIAGAREQPQTAAGAAATAAGFMRFLMQYPWPSEQELTTALLELSMAKDAQEAEDAAKALRSTPGPQTARTAGSSLADGRYVVTPGSTPEQAQVSIAAQTVTDRTLTGGSVAMTFTMIWTDEGWKTHDLGQGSDETEVLNSGTAFVGGC